MGKERWNDRGSSDELAQVKAAAWAWYERGSGSDRKPNMREYDLTKTQTTSRPTRFKVEAMKMIKMSTPLKPRSSEKNALRIDSYKEEINRSLGSSPQARKGSVAFGANVISKKSNEVKKLKRLWLWRSRGAIMCGIGRDHRDVVNSATVFRNNGITAPIKPCVSIQ